MSQRIREDSPAEIATLTWLQQSLFRRSKPLESSLSTHAFIVECDRHYNHRVLGGSYFSALRYVPDVSRKKTVRLYRKSGHLKFHQESSVIKRNCDIIKQQTKRAD